MLIEGESQPKDPLAARSWLEQAISHGDAEAKALLGSLYLSGVFGSKGTEKAVGLLQEAATSGFPAAAPNSDIFTQAVTT